MANTDGRNWTVSTNTIDTINTISDEMFMRPRVWVQVAHNTYKMTIPEDPKEPTENELGEIAP